MSIYSPARRELGARNERVVRRGESSTERRIHRQASAGVRFATLSDEALLWELGVLHAGRAQGLTTDDTEERIVELEGEYLRRHPITEDAYRALPDPMFQFL